VTVVKVSHCLSGTWLLELREECVALRRPSDGAVIELEGLDHAAFRALWTTLIEPQNELELERLFEPWAELLPVFLEEGVLRAHSERPLPSVEGDGSLRALLDELVANGGWRLPPLTCLSDEEGSEEEARKGSVGLAAFGTSIVAIGLGCPGCLRLRALGASGEPGAEQTLALAASPLPWAELSALLASALVELEREPLARFEGLWVRHETGLLRGRVLRHADCSCRVTRPSVFGPSWLRGDLERDGSATSAERIRAVFGDSPLAPLAINEKSMEPGALPFDEPFISGTTRLSRRLGNTVLCTSSPAIAHGSASTLERSRLLAWSEGVERLAAQGAVADLLLPSGDPRVRETCRVYGWNRSELAERTAFCRGLDLLRGVECLVPFGRVAVALPPALCPDGLPTESTFTGAASHVSSLEAILHGSVELLKRDAFMIAWYRRRRLASVAIPRELPAEVAERLAYLERHGLRLRLFDLRADLPLPMLVADVRAKRRIGNWPEGGAVLVPAGGFTPFEALRHLVTLVCTRFVGLGLDASPEHDPLDAMAVAELGRRIPFWPPLARYLDPRHAAAFDFLQSNATVRFEELDAGVPDGSRDRFRLLGDWLRRAGLSWIAVPLSDDHTIEAGLRVTKVVVPEAVRMTLSADDVERGQRRFARDFPGASPGSWNPDPHPVY
jgi:thiazole/oxazole-forming peptide maturase SagD family component